MEPHDSASQMNAIVSVERGAAEAIRSVQTQVAAIAAARRAWVAEAVAAYISVHHAEMVAGLREAMMRAILPRIHVGAVFERSERELRKLEPRAFELGTLGWTLPLWAHPLMLRDVFVDARPEEVDAAFESYYTQKRGVNARTLFAEIEKSASMAN